MPLYAAISQLLMTGDEQATRPPKVFISYSWSSPDYMERVLQLAEHLVSDGVDVVLDRWHLQEGQDAYRFMERAVTDLDVERVLILCDPLYAAKAKDREGGVGTETLIISPEVYREAGQTKFVPVLMERDENGGAVVPAYLKGRIHIDLSRPETEATQYDRLLRLLFGKPEVLRPALGRPPAFLDEERPVLLTGRALEQYKDAVLRDRPTQHGYLTAYLERLADAFAQERICEVRDGQELLEQVRTSIDRFRPYRDEFAGLMQFLRDYGEGPQPYERLHRFFEHVLNIREQHEVRGFNQQAGAENLAFLLREMWLYAVAALIRGERFEAISRLLAPFHVRHRGSYSGGLHAVGIFDPHLPQLDGGFRAMGDPIAALLKSRATLQEFPYESLAEAEFLLALRTFLEPPGPLAWQDRWFPRGSGWAWAVDRLPLRLRMQDPAYIERIFPALGIRDRGDLMVRVSATADREPSPEMQWLDRRGVSLLFQLSVAGP